MSALFLKIVNMSIAASWLILAVLLLRVLLRKAPRWISVLLWGIVAIRLVCPVTLESALSLIPSRETIPVTIGMAQEPAIQSGIPILNEAVNSVIRQSGTPSPADSVAPVQIWITGFSIVWMIGVAAMLLYAAVSLIRLHKRVSISLHLKDRIWVCDEIQTPFILGFFNPKIFLPSGTEEDRLSYIIAHENAHLQRRDHWWKPLGFLVLAIHWFNPLVWAAYILLCRDIELACDEKVIKNLGKAGSIAYSEALLACSVSRKTILICPLAFGEVGVKERVKHVLNYKKPAFWVIIAAVVISVILSVCFLTNPSGQVLTSWEIDEVDMKKALQNVDSMTVQYLDDAVVCREGEIGRFLATMGKIKIRKDPVLQSRSEERDQSFTIEVNNHLRLHFNFVFSEIWIDNGAAPSFSYEIANPETARELLFDYHFTQDGVFKLAVKWFDYLETPDQMSDAPTEMKTSEFPGVIFRCDRVEMEAITEEKSTELYSGMPIWNTFIYDLTGDEKPELCSTISFGSGLIDTRIVVYDYANGVRYELSDRGNYDFRLRMNEQNGKLYIDKTEYGSNELVQSGRLIFKDHTIEIEEIKQEAEQGSFEELAAGLLNTICQSSNLPSDPGADIRKAQKQYDELLGYGEATLRYCFCQFLEGSQTGLEGQIMAQLCRDIMETQYGMTQVDLLYETGQAWFDAFYAESLKTAESVSLEDLEKFHPVNKLLLDMTGEDQQ